MKKLLFLIICLFIVPSLSHAFPGGAWDSGRTRIEEVDGSPTGKYKKLKVTNGTLTDNLDGSVTLTIATASGGGDAVTVNGSAVDTTANIKDGTDIAWTLTDGGAGGPDDITGAVADDSHNHTGASLSGIDISADTNLAVTANEITLTDDTLSLVLSKDLVAGTGLSGGADNILIGADSDVTVAFDSTEVEATTWGAGGNASNIWTFNVSGTDHTMTIGSALITFSNGVTVSGTLTMGTIAGAIDAGGATSFEVPNGTNPTTDADGEIALDTNDSAIEIYNGGVSKLIPATKTSQVAVFDPDTVQPTYAFIPVLHVDKMAYPAGIKIIKAGIRTDAVSSYSVIFYESATEPTVTLPATIVSVATSNYWIASTTTITDADVAPDTTVYVQIPSTAANMLHAWISYYVKENS